MRCHLTLLLFVMLSLVVMPAAAQAEHAADTAEPYGLISLSELLRVIQFYNTGGLHCAALPEDTEDGYLPGPGINANCTPHDSDYAPQDWDINLAEILRLIQIFNAPPTACHGPAPSPRYRGKGCCGWRYAGFRSAVLHSSSSLSRPLRSRRGGVSVP